MTRYLAKRVAQSVAVVFGALVVVFVISRMIGDPVSMMLPPSSPIEDRVMLRHQLGLDQPIPMQLADYMWSVLHGDFGVSMWQRVPSLPLVLSRVPATLYLTVATLGIAIPIGLILGTFAAARPGTILDRFINVLSFGGVSIVHFWLALMLVLAFPVGLGWFKTGGFGGFGLDGVAYAVLPVMALCLRPLGRITQFTRSAVLAELKQPYIKVARAKGCGRIRVLGHALKNAGVPVITAIGDDIHDLIGGTVVVETVFAWPGIGLMLIQSIKNRDLVLVQTTAIVIAVLVILVNLLVDLAYTALDPKISFK